MPKKHRRVPPPKNLAQLAIKALTDARMNWVWNHDGVKKIGKKGWEKRLEKRDGESIYLKREWKNGVMRGLLFSFFSPFPISDSATFWLLQDFETSSSGARILSPNQNAGAYFSVSGDYFHLVCLFIFTEISGVWFPKFNMEFFILGISRSNLRETPPLPL